MKVAPAVALSLFLLSAAAAQAQPAAAPPLGLWNGAAATMKSYKVRLWLRGDGSYVYFEGPSIRLSGRWDWQSSSPVGGILTLHYETPTYTQTFHNNLYLGITYLSRTKIQARAGPLPSQVGILYKTSN